jgi:hypothetical protein
MEIKAHREVWASACPWALIDMTWVKWTLRDYNFSWKIEFNLTRYYSPEEWQSKYYSAIDWYYWQKYIDLFKNYSKWYEMEVCMNCWCDLDWHQLYDCTVPADWYKLTAKEAMKVVACPKEYPLWTKFHIDWIWDVVCRDRGGAIEGNKLDIWMGYWEAALNNWDKIISGKSIWYVIE